ncbi:hypothetical protein [Pseudofrankia sp. DC12]|uniref:hypothetical protein n=1 Tax=Pseudofrankia sp. DC12 TaxID=683315 RepID=UPI000697320D|nr:hypothetical protein [Pseudofrankia sp. DC12]
MGLCDLGDRFRLVANTIEVVEPDRALPRLPVACAVWAPRPDLPTSAECWLTAGGPHHTVLSTAVDVDMLDMFASMTSVELALIDGGTTVRSFVGDLRLNDLHFSLDRRR